MALPQALSNRSLQRMPRQSVARSSRANQRLQHQRLYAFVVAYNGGRRAWLTASDSIFLSLSPRPTLFSSFKYVGNAFDGDMARMAANPKVQEWWRMTDGMQESPVEGATGSAGGPGWWGQTEEVFFTE